MTRAFAQEQRVQEAIAYIQKSTHVSILQLNVPAIRQWIARGASPSDVAQFWITQTSEKEH